MNSYTTYSQTEGGNGAIVYYDNADTYTPDFKISNGTYTAMTIILRAKVVGASNTGFDLEWSIGQRDVLRISSTNIALVQGSTVTYNMDATQWHTYYVTFLVSGGTVTTNVYVDSSTTPVLSRSVTNAAASQIRLGKITSGAVVYNAELDWMCWTFDGAYAPGTANLPGGVYTFGTVAKKKK